MIKVFTTNKEGKIELSKDELKSLLDEAYWTGWKENSGTYTYHSPYTWTNTASNTWTLNASSMTGGTISSKE